MAKAGWPKGRAHTEETRRKISEALRGRKHTPEMKKRIKAGLRRHYLEMPADELENTTAA